MPDDDASTPAVQSGGSASTADATTEVQSLEMLRMLNGSQTLKCLYPYHDSDALLPHFTEPPGVCVIAYGEGSDVPGGVQSSPEWTAPAVLHRHARAEEACRL